MVFKKFLLLLCLFLVYGVHAQNIFDDYRLIGNNIGKKYITYSEVLSSFKAEKDIWNSGYSVKIFLPSNKIEETEKFYKEIYNKSLNSTKKFFVLLSFQGRSLDPFYFDTYEEMVNQIYRKKGAIAIVPNSVQVDSDYILNVVMDK